MTITLTTTLLEKFSQTQAAPARFFAHALQSSTLAHAYILQGAAVNESYGLALEIGKILNCSAPPAPGSACGMCKDCRWVTANSHPAIITLSRITYLDKDAKKTAMSKIRTEQVGQLLEQLAYSSDHMRVVIFTDAEELPSAAIPSSVTPPYEWQEANEGKDKSFHIRPLLRQHFNEASGNRFLKTLEEPPKNTMFFFITDNGQNLLETIVSRCQLVRMTGHAPAQASVLEDQCRPFFETVLLPMLSSRDFYQTADVFKAQMVEEFELSTEQAVGLFQRFLRQRFVATGSDARRYAETQRLLDETGRMLRDRVNAEQALNGLFERLSGQPLI